MRRLSVVIPIYKVEQYLPKCLDSVLLPGREDYEILCVDDGSPDRSGQIAEEYARRFPGLIRVIHQANGGLGAARNTGLEAAEGEFLLFLDSDDSLAPGALEEMLALDLSGADVCVFGFLKVDEEDRTLEELKGSSRVGRFTLAEAPELLLDPPNAWNKLWRRSLFLESGIRYPARLWYEDLATSPGLYLQAGTILALDRPWIRYLMRGGSITNSKNLARNAEIIPAVDSALDFFRKTGRFEEFAPALEAMSVYHQLLTATVRVNAIDPKSPLQRELQEDLERKFPRWRENSYVKAFPKKHRLLLQLMDRHAYSAVHVLMRANSLVRGKRV